MGKACPENCNAPHGNCKLSLSANGDKVSKCICAEGWAGADCMSKGCAKDCQHGKCLDGKCKCDRGFMGDDCSLPGCPDNCNDHGACDTSSGVALCKCAVGYHGEACSKRLPEPMLRTRCLRHG